MCVLFFVAPVFCFAVVFVLVGKNVLFCFFEGGEGSLFFFVVGGKFAWSC